MATMISRMAVRMPGPKPPRNRPPMDVLVETPYTTMGMLGGIRMPRQPEAAIRPREKSLS